MSNPFAFIFPSVALLSVDAVAQSTKSEVGTSISIGLGFLTTAICTVGYGYYRSKITDEYLRTDTKEDGMELPQRKKKYFATLPSLPSLIDYPI